MKKQKLSPDERFIKDKINSDGIVLPDSLSADNVCALVEGKKQKTPKRTVIRRIVSVSVAACIVLCSLVIYDSSVYAPKLNTSGSVACAESYSQLSGLMKDYFKSEKMYLYTNSIVFGRTNSAETVEDAMPVAEAKASASFNSEMPQDGRASDASEKSEYSTTNLREIGIEEADVVKTDGEYIYVLSSSELFIIKADGSELSLTGKVDMKEHADVYRGDYSDFYVTGNRLVVRITKAVDPETNEVVTEGRVRNAKPVSGVVVYDISDKSSPAFVRELMFDGSAVSSRIVNGSLILVTAYYVNSERFEADDYTTFVPAVYEDGDTAYPEASEIAILGTEEPDTFLTVSKTDLINDQSEPQTLTAFGAGTDIYCTASTLYVFAANYGRVSVFDGLINTAREAVKSSVSSGIKTDIISFDISGAKPELKAKGCVSGTLLNTWSLDEYNGRLRLAAVNEATRVYVLDETLTVIGSSEPMAQGEQIKSVRFSGDTAYVVTFFQTDPLFVIDLSDPTKPVIKGELKLPGFSNYLHPAGDGLMLGIGQGGTEFGVDGSAKISLFDVSDPENPFEVNSVNIADAWFDYDYRSFVSVGDGTFIIPVTRYIKEGHTDKNGSYYYGYREITGAMRVGTENGKLVPLAEYEAESITDYSNAVRAMFIGNTVYLIERDVLIDGHICVVMTAFELESGEKLSSQVFRCE